MGEELNLDVIQETQESLGKFIKKPQLTEKLLRKPPFKFLHDVITSVISTTGFMRNVYSEEELNSENIKDRDSKIAFLQKAIDHVALITGETLKIHPNKTVAGHEAANTNEFLQTLSRAIIIHNDRSNDSPILKPKSPTKSSQKKTAVVDSSDHKKSRQKELQVDAEESPKRSSGNAKLDRTARSDVKKSKRDSTSKMPTQEKNKKSERENTKYSEKDHSRKSERENAKNSEKETSKKSERQNKHSEREASKKTDRESSKNSIRESNKKSERENSKNSVRETGKKSEENRKNVAKESNKKTDRETKKRSERETVKKSDKELVKISANENSKSSENDMASKKDPKHTKKSEMDSAKRVSSKERGHSRENGDIPRSKNNEVSQSKERDRKDSSSAEVTRERRGSKDVTRGIKSVSSNRRESLEKNQGPNSPMKSSKKKNEEIEEDLSALSQNEGNVDATVLSVNELSNGNEIETNNIQLNSQSQALNSRILTGRPPTGRPMTAKLTTSVPSSTEITSKTEEATDKISNQEITSQMSDSHESAQGSEVVQRPATSTIRRSTARPPTARPAAPRVRVVDSAPEEPQSQEQNKQVTSIILDGDIAKDDDDEGFLIEDPTFVTERQNLLNHGETFEELNAKPHGSLVAQILETKKDLESGSQRPGTGFKRVDLDKSLLSDSARKKEREVYSREMNNLRECVQTLTRSANPLGKLIDFLQEDVDAMLRELDIWSSERQKHELALQKEESKADLELESLQHQLQEVEDVIENQVAKIFAVKATIIRNEERIQKMVAASRI